MDIEMQKANELLEKIGEFKLFYRQRSWVAKNDSGEGKGSSPIEAIKKLCDNFSKGS